MKLLNVIDLDKTLIETDSFREFILRYLNVRVFFFILLRFFRIISREKFAEEVTKELRKILEDDKKICEFAALLNKRINDDVLKTIKSHSDKNSVTLLLSASPEEYVKKVAESLGFKGLGSHWKGNVFFHCYGENKVRLLKGNYPATEYDYNFAISDNADDINLLKMFRNYELFKGEK